MTVKCLDNIDNDPASSLVRPEIWNWWDYSDGVSGPALWGVYFPLCDAGRFQSPINIESRYLSFDHQLTPIYMNNSENVCFFAFTNKRRELICLLICLSLGTWYSS